MICRIRSASSALFTILALVITLTTLCASVTVAHEEGPASASGLIASMPFVVPDAPVPGGPGFYSQSALAFRPWPSQGVPFSYTGVTLYNPDTASHYYTGVVSLPQGATITKFVVWYYDNNATLNITAQLVIVPSNSDYGTLMAAVNSSDASAQIRYGETTAIVNPKIDMQSNSYAVQVALPPNSAAGIVSFRIDYMYPGYLPLVTKQ